MPTPAEPAPTGPDRGPSLDTLRPRRSLLGRIHSLVLGLVTLLVLVWAWNSGEVDFSKVWRNGDRLVDMVLGPTPSAEDLAKYESEGRRLAEREFAGERWEAAREAGAHDVTTTWLAERFRFPNEASYPEWLRDDIAAERERLGEAYERRIERRIREHVRSEERKTATGLLPPALAPDMVFGDPERAFRAAPGADGADAPGFAGSFQRFADRMPGPVRDVLRYGFASASGEGYIGKLIETIAIAIWATIFAFLLALPASLFGAHRSVRLLVSGTGRIAGLLRGGMVFAARRSFDVSRGFNEIVLALLLVAVFNIGPFPGLLALAIHTYGVLGKVFADAIEAAEAGPVEGVKSTGAGSVQIVSFALLPQIMPFVVSQTLLRFESNVRAAAILGVVGAGGVGQLLDEKVQSYKFDEVGTILVLLIITVAVIDRLTTNLMKKFI